MNQAESRAGKGKRSPRSRAGRHSEDEHLSPLRSVVARQCFNGVFLRLNIPIEVVSGTAHLLDESVIPESDREVPELTREDLSRIFDT